MCVVHEWRVSLPSTLTLLLWWCRLDPALIRPGRVDIKQMIDNATEYQLRLMFQRFYPEQPAAMAMEFAAAVLSHGRKVSMAQVQGLFMLHKSEPSVVLGNIEKMWSL